MHCSQMQFTQEINPTAAPKPGSRRRRGKTAETSQAEPPQKKTRRAQILALMDVKAEEQDEEDKENTDIGAGLSTHRK